MADQQNPQQTFEANIPLVAFQQPGQQGLSFLNPQVLLPNMNQQATIVGTQNTAAPSYVAVQAPSATVASATSTMASATSTMAESPAKITFQDVKTEQMISDDHVYSSQSQQSSYTIFSAMWSNTLNQGLGELYQKQELCDIKIQANDSRFVSAHKCVLAASSTALHKLCVAKLEFEGQSFIQLNDITFPILEYIVQFIYTGKVEVPPDSINDLYQAAGSLQLTELQAACNEVPKTKEILSSMFSGSGDTGTTSFMPADDDHESDNESFGLPMQDEGPQDFKEAEDDAIPGPSTIIAKKKRGRPRKDAQRETEPKRTPSKRSRAVKITPVKTATVTPAKKGKAKKSKQQDEEMEGQEIKVEVPSAEGDEEMAGTAEETGSTSAETGAEGGASLTEASPTASKGTKGPKIKKGKLKKRIEKEKCLECGKDFFNLQNHMAVRHPRLTGYKEDDIAKGIEMVKNGASLSKVKKELHIPISTLHHRLKKGGITREWKQEQVDKAQEMIKNGASIANVQKALKVPMLAVYNKFFRTQKERKKKECPECGKEFYNLKNHMKSHSLTKKEKEYCSICCQYYLNLPQHRERRHSIEKPFVCPTCGHQCSRKKQMKLHMLVHSQIKQHGCLVCDRRFRRRESLRKHMRTHTGEKPYVCDICGKAFSQRGMLKDHIRVHTGEKPFICSVCNQAFRQFAHLQTHKRSHTGEKPYTCKVCGQSYSLPVNLRQHMEKHHSAVNVAIVE